jgi:cytochrome c oxidase cbb3-type subunit III
MRHSQWLMSIGLAVVTLAMVHQDATGQTQDHQYSTADIETGSRLYVRQCALCHGPNGDQVTGVDLRRGRFRRFLSDEDLRGVISNGIPAAGMPSFRLATAELNGLVAFIRAGFDVEGTAVRIGNAELGRALFAGEGGCTDCHRVEGIGPTVGPDLSDIGAIRQPAALQRTLLDPTAAMLPINRPVRVVMTDGRTIRGRRLNEDTYTVQLIDADQKLVSVDKSQIREFEVGTTSPMPSMADRLSADEIAHVIAYLLTLTGR